MDFRLPVARRGKIVSIPDRLSRRASLDMAERLASAADDLHKVIEQALREDPIASKGEVFPPSGKADLIDREITPVVRFPEHEIVHGGYRFQGRIHISVCAEERHSKLWHRLAFIEPPTGSFDPFDASMVEAFYSGAYQTSGSILKVVREYYLEILAESFDTDDLRDELEVSVCCANSTAPQLRELTNALATHELESPDQVFELEHWKPAHVALDDYFRMCGFDGTGKRMPLADEHRQAWKYVGAGDVGSIYHSVSLSDADVPYVGFLGIAYSEGQDMLFAESTPSISTSRAIAQDLARIL